MKKFYPEGYLINTSENKKALSSKEALTEAYKSSRIIEAIAIFCDTDRNLHVDLGVMKGIIPKNEVAIGVDEGLVKDVAIISRVNRPVMCRITGFCNDETGKTMAILSRKSVQLECKEEYVSALVPGQVIDAVVTRPESFGAFVDIGAGISALIPISFISIARVPHSSARFSSGDKIKAVVENIGEKITLSHKELLGTWKENAAHFKAGETVPGIVRSICEHGVFVELKPNLVGLAEYVPGVKPGQYASVYIKSILPKTMRTKISLVDFFEEERSPEPLDYYITDGSIDRWVYSPDDCSKIVETDFLSDKT